jgi:hypothetical protein
VLVLVDLLIDGPEQVQLLELGQVVVQVVVVALKTRLHGDASFGVVAEPKFGNESAKNTKDAKKRKPLIVQGT